MMSQYVHVDKRNAVAVCHVSPRQFPFDRVGADLELDLALGAMRSLWTRGLSIRAVPCLTSLSGQYGVVLELGTPRAD